MVGGSTSMQVGPIGMLKWSRYLGEVEEFIAATAEGQKPSVMVDDHVQCLEGETAVCTT